MQVSETSLSEKSWLMAQSLSNYRGQISPRHLKSTALNGRFIKITKYLLKSQRCLDTNTHINEAKTHIGWFFFIFPNRDWPHACFWKLFGIFFKDTPKNTPKIHWGEILDRTWPLPHPTPHLENVKKFIRICGSWLPLCLLYYVRVR